MLEKEGHITYLMMSWHFHHPDKQPYDKECPEDRMKSCLVCLPSRLSACLKWPVLFQVNARIRITKQIPLCYTTSKYICWICRWYDAMSQYKALWICGDCAYICSQIPSSSIMVCLVYQQHQMMVLKLLLSYLCYPRHHVLSNITFFVLHWHGSCACMENLFTQLCELRYGGLPMSVTHLMTD